jgi:hypothetical protein
VHPKGRNRKKIIIMTDVDAPLRNNEFSIDEHVKDVENPSPFVKMGFNMVTGFVIDSMHTMISGAFLRKLDGFASNPLERKLSSTQLAQVEKRLKFYRHCRPYEFDRYVGSFSQCVESIKGMSYVNFFITYCTLFLMGLLKKTN